MYIYIHELVILSLLCARFAVNLSYKDQATLKHPNIHFSQSHYLCKWSQLRLYLDSLKRNIFLQPPKLDCQIFCQVLVKK